MRFSVWTVTNGVALDDETSAQTSFRMPAFAVAATANYEVIPTYPLTMVNGIANPAGPNPAGTVVTITASAPPPGQAFARWRLPDGVEIADPRAAQTTFVMPDAATTVTAQFQLNTPSDLVYSTEDGPGCHRPR